MKRAGFTLVEILVATMISALVATLAISVYTVTVNRESSNIGSFEVESQLAHTVDVLREELRETNFSSIHLGVDNLSFASANPMNEISSMEVSRFGAPKWQKTVLYSLRPDPQNPALSHLIRQEAPLDGLVPLQAPNSDGDPSSTRVITRHLISKGYEIKKSSDGQMRLQSSDKAAAGFAPRFVDKHNNLSLQRPGASSATELLNIDLHFANLNQKGHLHSAHLQFRIFPRN